MGWVSQATEKVSEAATQALQPIEKGLSQGITNLGRTIADNPALEIAITAIATYAKVPPSVTASFLAANKTSQTGGNLEKGLETLILSYGGAQFVPVEGINLATSEGIATAQTAAQTAATIPPGAGANAAGSLFSEAAAAATGGGEAVSTLVGGGGVGDGLIAASQPSMAGQFGFGAASPAVTTAAAETGGLLTQPSMVGQFGFGNVAAPAATTSGLLSGASTVPTLTPAAIESLMGLEGYGVNAAAQAAAPAFGIPASTVGAGALIGSSLGSSALGGGSLADAAASSIASGAGGESGSLFSSIGSTLSNLLPSSSTVSSLLPSLITGGLQGLGAANTAEKAREAAQIQAAAQVEAARIAAEAAKFRPVGVTTRFGTSQFTTDAQGNVIGAGYTASPEIKAYQDRLSALAASGLTGAEGAQAAYAPLTAGAQSLFNLGQGYIQQTPEQQAAAYIAKQQALLAPGQEQQLALLQNKLFQQGRGGATVAQGGNLAATSPELAAYYNALAQSNLQLAAQGQQAGMEQARFGAGLLGTGSDLMGKYYGGQTAAYAPFATAMDTSTGLENLAQQPMTLGTQIGAKTTASAAEAGRLLSQGMIQSAATQAPANAFSQSGNIFGQFGSNPQLLNALNTSFGVTDPNQVAMQTLLKKIYGV